MKDKLNKYESDVLRDYESGRLKKTGNFPVEKKRYESYARETLKKNRRINIRMSEYDLKAIRLKAMAEGVPYQTFISSVLHKVADGRISHHPQ